MPNLSPQSRAILDRFRQKPGVTADQADNLESAIEASPWLVDRFNDAVAQGLVRDIAPLAEANAGGTYDPKNQTIKLPLSNLTTTPPPGVLQRYNEGSMIFVLGHELEHGFNSAAMARADEMLINEVEQKAKLPPPRDYTAEVGKLLASSRSDEARAEIAGWNAVVSAVKVNNPTPTLQDIYDKTQSRMADFIDRKGDFPVTAYTLKENITINPDMTMDPALVTNVEAMGKHYFDKAPRQAGLGPHGQSDYTNLYGRYPISVIDHYERYNTQQSGPILLDLTKLHLDEKLLEENGLNLSAPGRTLPYVDVSTGTPGRFDHTKETKAHVPIIAEPRIPPSGDPVVDRWIGALQDGDHETASRLAREFARSPDGQRLWNETLAEAREEELRQKPWLAHARDTPLFNQAMGHVDRLEPQLGQYWSREQKEQLAGVIAFEARHGRLQEIHDVVPLRDGGLMAVWEHPRDRIFDQRTGVIDPAQAVDQPLRQSMQQFNDETMQQQHEATMREQQRQTQGRGMSM